MNWRVDSARVSNKTNNHHSSKSVWGFENALLLKDTRGIKAYIRMRAGLVEIPRRPDTSVCGLCFSHLPTTALALWECLSLEAPRKNFLRSLELADHSLYRAILAASPTNAMHIVLGKGVEMVPEANWEKIQDLCIMYIAEVVRIMDPRD